MKNSLFKRAIAVASAVPVALTQCLSVANAVYVDYSVSTAAEADSTTFTLDKGEATSIFYIEPNEDVEAYVREGNVFTKSSNWNSRLATAISNVDATNGVLDLSKAYELAIEKSGDQKEVVSSLIDQMGDVTYSVSEDGMITIEGTLGDVTPTFTAGGSNTIGGALKDLAAEYGVEDLDTPDNFFEDVVIGCSVKAVVDGSKLADGTVVTASFELTDTATGKVYKGLGAIDWALEKFDLLKSTAKDACDEYSEYVDTTDAYKQIDDSVSFYVDKLEAAKKYIAKAYEFEKSISAATTADAIAQAKDIFANDYNNTIPVINKKVNRELPDSFAQAAGNEKAQEYYNKALGALNGKVAPYTFDITLDECAALADGFTDITASVSNGVATFTAKFEDKEAAAAEAYIEGEYNVNVVEIYKTITVIGDATTLADAAGGFATADIQIERVVKVEDVVTTTTTTTTSATTDTTETTVTTVSTVDGSDVVTTASTVEGGDVVTTTASTVEGGDVVTTTVSTVDTPGSSTTTTRTETKYVVNFDTQTVVGFYLDIDPEFNIEQVKSLGYSVDYSVLSYGEDGSLVSQEVIIKGDVVDITKSIEFKDVPADVFKLINTDNVNQFAAQIQIYATEDITAADGTVVAKAGDALKNVDGSSVSATAYIGVKGDASLDMKADSIDASVVLAWYAKISTGGVPGEIQFSNNDLLVQNNPVLDDFAAFLADVDNENDSANYVTLKTARTIDSKDSSNILAYYAQLMTGAKAGRDTWNNVLGEYGKYN